MITKLLRTSAVATAVGLIVSFASGVVCSRAYWGYYFTAPSIAPWIQRLSVVDAYEEFAPPWQQRDRPNESPAGRMAVVNASKLYIAYGTVSETGKLAFELNRAGKFPATDRRVGNEVFKAVCQELDRHNVLRDGEPGYRNTKRLFGSIAVGHDHTGQELIIASLGGAEASNDHYPRYQAIFGRRHDKPVLLASRRYFVDIAGIEGADWLAFALAIAVILVPVAVGVSFALVLFRKRRRIVFAERLSNST